MEYVLERRESTEVLYATNCPKCGLIVPSPEDPCPWCHFSVETELTREEAKEFTYAGD